MSDRYYQLVTLYPLRLWHASFVDPMFQSVIYLRAQDHGVFANVINLNFQFVIQDQS